MNKRTLQVLILLGIAAVTGWVIAQEMLPPDQQEAQGDQAQQELAPETVLATIGEDKVVASEVTRFLEQSRIPPSQQAMVRYQGLMQVLANRLMDKFISTLDIEAEDEFQKIKTELQAQAQSMGMDMKEFLERNDLSEEDLRKQAKVRKTFEEVTSEEKAKQYVQDHQRIFSGTGVTGQVVFTDVKFYDETSLQKETLDEMKKVAQAINAGQTTVEEAIGAHPEWRDSLVEAEALEAMHPGLALAVANTEPGKATEPIQLGQGMAMFLVKDIVESQAILADKARQMVEKKGTEASEDEIQKLVKEHPEYFDGTTVQASHVLLKVEPETPEEKRKELKAKLEQISKDIAEGKTTFAEAARAHSDCPSSEKGGDLGAFAFEQMVTPFSKAAFATELGKITDIVETQYGYHIIKVTKIAGPEQADMEAAKNFLTWSVQKDMFQQAFRTPIKITEEGEVLKKIQEEAMKQQRPGMGAMPRPQRPEPEESQEEPQPEEAKESQSQPEGDAGQE